MMTLVQLLPGKRQSRDNVWDYFEYVSEKSKSCCITVDSKETTECSTFISRKNTTNLKKHLKRYHKNIYDNLQKKSEKSTKSQKGRQYDS